MSKKRKTKEKLRLPFFVWTVRDRDGVWQADGRGNTVNPGRHSLGTKDYEEGLEKLQLLDKVQAVALGLADPSILSPGTTKSIALDAGKDMYLKHVARPFVAGGGVDKTQQRYEAVLNKFVPWVKLEGLEYWEHIKRRHLTSYADWLLEGEYEYATVFLELTTIKQVFNYFIREELLPVECKIHMPLRKPSGTNTFCYTKEQLTAMADRCSSRSGLAWLRAIICGLSFTGMRISELTGLRPSDVDLDKNMITLTDERFNRTAAPGTARRMKNSRNRSFPIHSQLLPIIAPLVKRGASRVFTGPDGQKISGDAVRLAFVSEVIDPLSEKYPSGEDEIGFKDGRLHSFRHYFCSLVANAGVSELAVMRWLGHGSSLMVKHYYHLNDPESQRQMEKVDFKFGSEAE
ncbi:tyrosine-type recombinase/integrase [Anatilimnocola floriformis]|uniref:tyrosine-type recombinase/integrase n=1 Tax=Anatilimnocola floriformis TaxID=2948575 RepID=UPI0020C4719F|nr:site-specific integrase [Anatilimnocola floriformis]